MSCLVGSGLRERVCIATAQPRRVRIPATPSRSLFAMLITIVSVVLAPPARGSESPPLLNDVAHVYSLGAGEIRCPSEAVWINDPYSRLFSWGYTNERWDYTVLPPPICEGAASVGSTSVPEWQQAAGIWMLVHESFHLRHWRFRRNEAKVGCQTIVYFTDAATRLGASEQQAQELYPYALALHDLELRLYPWRRDSRCIVPPWTPPPGSIVLRVRLPRNAAA